jgi:hypothetical protein
MIPEQDEPSPRVRRDNFRYLGDLAPERELWWAMYGAALELTHIEWNKSQPPPRQR